MPVALPAGTQARQRLDASFERFRARIGRDLQHRIIFGPQFCRAYAATAGEDDESSGESVGMSISRFTVAGNQPKR